MNRHTANIGARDHASRPQTTEAASASNRLPPWASNIQARHLLEKLAIADLYLTGGQSADDGLRYRSSVPIALGGGKVARMLGNLRLLADLYRDAVAHDLPALTAHYKTSRGFNHEADALLAVVRGDGVKIGAAA